MGFSVQQVARTGLAGGTFFDLLRQFSNEPLAVLYSGHGKGQSVIARRPLMTVSARHAADGITIFTAPGIPPFRPSQTPDLLDQWEHALAQPILHGTHSPLTRWIGEISYDLGRTLESIGEHAADDLRWPLLHWRLFDEYYLFDHDRKSWSVIVSDWPGRKSSANTRLDAMLLHLSHAPPTRLPAPFPAGELVDSLPRADYLRRVQRIKDYIAAGDIFQANFAQRWTVRTAATAIDIFEKLMHETPAPYAALLIDGRRAAISASPELLVHLNKGHMVTRPIKGTRPRDRQDPVRDAALRDELLHAEKDKAELAMIVDLLRNDLGRLAEFGSVLVAQRREIEAHPTVWHAVATLQADIAKHVRDGGDYDPGTDPRLNTFGREKAAVIRALWPGGSITGAPKIRAMQILEELEPYRRGLYCGAIGTATSFHRMTLNIAIRTIQMIGNRAYLYAGGGIVADSDPEQEYEETLHKAAALFRAVGVQA